MTLDWTASTDSAGVSTYTVYSGSTTVATAAGSATTAAVDNLTPSTTYTFTVTAKDAAGNTSPSSAPLTVTTASGGAGGSGCTPVAGSGAITNYSACVSGGNEVFQATFNTSVSLHHVFLNSDDNTATGYQLPSPSTTPLGADYMIENNILYKSVCGCWGWSAVSGVNPNMTVNGSTYSWTIPLSALGGPAPTEQAEFNGNTSYTAPITFSGA